MTQAGLAPRILLAFTWSLGCVLVLVGVDLLVKSPGTGGGSVLFFLLATLYAALAFGVSRLAGLGASRAVLLGSLVCVAALVPSMVRLHDAPLVAELSIENPPLYPRLILLGVGAGIFVVMIASHERLEAKLASLSAKPGARPDPRLLGSMVVMAMLSAPLIVSRVRLPAVTEVDVPETHAEMMVPTLDSAAGDAISIFDDGAVAVSAVRTHPLPLQIASLRVDLRDGVGERVVIPVGGGEQLQLVHRARLLWEICHVPPPRGRDIASKVGREPCVTMARFIAAKSSFDPRVSAVRGRVGPSSALLGVAAISFLVVAVVFAVRERSRRRLLRVTRGQQGMMQPDGVIESLGERYALREPPRHTWAGPVVLLDVAESVDPYRETRSAGSVVPGTIEQHVAWYAHQRRVLHHVIDVPCLLVIAHLATAAIVGYWGF